MRFKYSLTLLVLILSLSAFSQRITISGYISDCKTGEKLIGVFVKDKINNKTVTSNNFGFYSLPVNSADSVEIEISFIGYQNTSVWLKANNNVQRNITICEGDYALQEVNVTANRFSDIYQNNVVSISMKEIKSLPSIFGETDVLRAYMLMPGVQGGKEGTSELYIRGGSPDQNLIMLDDIPLYYINHLGGFVSIFDNNALKNVDLIKGGFPARYGGRLSAVTDIRMKDGDMKHFGGEFTIGLISAKIMLEGPIKKDRSSFLITVRRSVFDAFLRPISLMATGGKSSAGYTFYDLNAKFQQKLTEKDRLFVSIYSGRDRIFMNFNESDKEKKYKANDNLNWGNRLASLRWNHQFSSKLFMNITGAYTHFAYHTDFEYKSELLDGTPDAKYLNKYVSDVADIISKADFDYYINPNHKVKFGTQLIFHTYEPGVVSFKKVYGQEANIDTTYGSSTMHSVESDTYIEDEIKLGKKISANLGLHYSAFSIENNVFQSWQPRAIVNYQPVKSFSVKASYSQMSQNIHLLSNSSSSQPTDLWVPATPKLKPENATQYSLGISSLLYKNILELSIDGYYKKMDNLIEYKEGASFFSNSKDWQEKVEVDGVGEVYGLEFLLRKRTGKTTGWIGYTLSKNERQFDNLNFGKPFPYKYDRRHDVSLVVTHQLSKNIILSASWTFNTGYHLTLAEGKNNLLTEKYQSPTLILPQNSVILPNLSYQYAYIYNGKNNYQTDNYHRLDISCSFIKELKHGTRTWNFSIYNVYNHLNPYYIYYRMEQKQLKLYQFSLFPCMPSFSYSYKF